jgi:hypothetical protein
VRASLVGTHLPRLAAAGIINYDGQTAQLSSTVRRHGLFGDEFGRSWATVYALAGSIIWLLILVVAAGIEPFSALSWGHVAAAGVVATVGIAISQARTQRRARRPLDSLEAVID